MISKRMASLSRGARGSSRTVSMSTSTCPPRGLASTAFFAGVLVLGGLENHRTAGLATKLASHLDRIERGDDPAGGIRAAAMSGAVAFAGLESMATGEITSVPEI